MGRLKKIAAEGRWWAKTAEGGWLVWDHLRADWAPHPNGPPPSSLTADFATVPAAQLPEQKARPAGVDYTTRRFRIIAAVAGPIAYLEFIHREFDQSLVAAALCLVAAVLSFRNLRDDLFIVGPAGGAMLGLAVWYGWTVKADAGFLLRIAALVGSCLTAVILRPGVSGFFERRSVPLEEKGTEELDTFEEGRPASRGRHYLASAIAGVFLIGTFLSLGEYLEPLGVAALVYTLAYFVGRRPSAWMVTGSVAMGIWFGFSVWFLASFANPDPVGFVAVVGAMMSLGALAYIFLSFAAAIVKGLTRTREQIFR